MGWVSIWRIIIFTSLFVRVIYVFFRANYFYVVSLIPIRLWQQWDVVFLLVAIVALILVFFQASVTK